MDFMWNLFGMMTLSDGNLETFLKGRVVQSILLCICEQGIVFGRWLYEA